MRKGSEGVRSVGGHSRVLYDSCGCHLSAHPRARRGGVRFEVTNSTAGRGLEAMDPPAPTGNTREKEHLF